MLDNRKSFLVARISAQVGAGVDGGPQGTESRPSVYSWPPGGGLLQGGMPGLGEPRHRLTAGPDPEGLEEACADEDLLLCSRGSCASPVTGGGGGGATTAWGLSRGVCPFFPQLHMGKQAEEQQKFGERVSELWQGGVRTDASRVHEVLERSLPLQQRGRLSSLSSPPHPCLPHSCRSGVCIVLSHLLHLHPQRTAGVAAPPHQWGCWVGGGAVRWSRLGCRTQCRWLG